MASNDIKLMMRIQADVQQAVREMRKMTNEVKAQGREGKKASQSMDKLAPAYQRIAAAAGAYFSVGAAIRALKLADEYTLIQARIRRATDTQAEYNRVSRELFDIAQRNGTALKDTADLFINLNRSAEDLGATRDQILKVTNAIQQLGVLSGASGEELKNALRQFGQAMAGGVVRAEEFNSIIENTPAIAERIARGMGTTVGQLRLAVNQGTVLSSQVFASLLEQVGQINQEFQAAPQSIEASANRLENAFAAALNRIDQTVQATATVKKLLDGMAAILEDIAQKDGDSKVVKLQKERLALFERERAIRAQIQDLESQQDQVRGAVNKIKLIRQLQALRAEAMEVRQLILDNQVLLTAENSAALQKASAPQEKPKPAPKPVDKAAEAAAKARLKSIENTIKALEEEAATYGQSAEQIALYRLQVQGATQAQLARARAAIANIEAEREFEAANKAAIEDAKRQAEEQKRLGEELDRQAQYWRDLINPVNQYQRQIEQLERLYNAGKISAETYAEATFRIQDAIDAVGQKANEAGDQMNQFAVQAARNIQDQLGSTLYNIADSSFQSILKSWVDMLRKMASEALAAQLAKKLLGDSFGKTGDLGGILGSLLSAIFHTGGIVGQAAPTRAVSPLLFVGAQRYHTGGFPGLAPNEVPAILQRGEEVLTRNDPRHALNGGAQAAKPQVRIVNVIDPAMVQDYMTSASGEDAILNVLSRRRSDVQAIVS